MRRRLWSQIAALGIALACLARTALGATEWDPSNPVHVQVMHEFSCSEELFPRMSGGLVRSSYAKPEDLVRWLKRQGIAVSTDDAKTLLNEVELTIKGRNPRKIRPADLVGRREAGSTGLHGFFAELDFVKANPDYINFSTNASTTTDATRRDSSGRVRAYCQVKCRSTARDSCAGVVENWIKFHAKPRGTSSPFIGVIPRDQFDDAVRKGIIAADGTVSAEFLKEIMAGIQQQLASKGSVNRDLIKAGLGAEKVHPLRFEPLPGTYDEYRETADAHEAKSVGPSSPLGAPGKAPRQAAAMAGMGGAAVMALLGLAQSRDLPGAGLATAQGMAGMLEQGQGFSGQQKQAIQRALRTLPRWLRPSMPRVGDVRTVGRWAARVGALVAVIVMASDLVQYSRGEMTTQMFTTSAAQLAGGFAGGWAGGKAGLIIGAQIGTLICPGLGTAVGGAVGATVGAIAGGFAGSMAAGSAASAVWASMDEQERDYAIDLIRERLRKEGAKHRD